MKPGAKIMPDDYDYPYLRAWDRMMGSSGWWCEENLSRARKEKAPQDAIYKSHVGKWHTYENIQRPDIKNFIRKLVEAHKAKE
jgi:hypothetical protein